MWRSALVAGHILVGLRYGRMRYEWQAMNTDALLSRPGQCQKGDGQDGQQGKLEKDCLLPSINVSRSGSRAAFQGSGRIIPDAWHVAQGGTGWAQGTNGTVRVYPALDELQIAELLSTRTTYCLCIQCACQLGIDQTCAGGSECSKMLLAYQIAVAVEKTNKQKSK